MFSYNILILVVAFVRQVARYPDFSRINWYFFSYRGLLKYFDIHATYLGLLNNLIILFLLLSLKKYNGSNRTLSYGMIVLSLLITVLSGSRIQIVVAIVMLLFFLIARFSKKGLIVFLGTIIFSGVLLTQIPIIKERVLDTVFNPTKKFEYAKYGKNPGDNASVKRRILMNNCGLEMFKEKWLFGYGSNYESSQKLLDCYKENQLAQAFENKYNVHNQYVGWLLTGGVLLFLIFMIVFYKSARKAISERDTLYLGFLSIIIITCCTENIFERHFGIVFFSLLNTFFYFYEVSENGQQEVSGQQ
ncbi:O-antigen ligase family protein [Flagellimonas sp. 2504JD4-2]